MADKIIQDAELMWIPIAEMRVSPLAQRELNPAWVSKIAANFDVDALGTPTVNRRTSNRRNNGRWSVIDGQHRIEALRALGWGDQQIQCWAYDGLSEQQEAEKFLLLNSQLTVQGYAKYRVGVEAGLPAETDIDRIIRGLGMRVGLDKYDGSIRCVVTLRRIYDRAGPDGLVRTMQIVRDAFGDAGLSAAVIGGIGLLCNRYPELDQAQAVRQLSNMRGGVSGLLGKAEKLKATTGRGRQDCVAAAAVEVLNSGRRGGQRFASWWTGG